MWIIGYLGNNYEYGLIYDNNVANPIVNHPQIYRSPQKRDY